MLLRTKSLIAFLCLVCLSSIALVRHLYAPPGATVAQWLPALKGHPVNPCPNNIDWLKALDLTYPIHYAQREIIVNPTPDCRRTSITKVGTSLFPDSQIIDLTNDPEIVLQHCAQPLVLDVPAFANGSGDASHLIFGISTTMRRLEDSIPQLLRWLPGTRAKLFVIVLESERVGAPEGQDETPAVKADPTQKKELESRIRGLGIDVTLFDPLALEDIFSEKYFSLVKIMYDNRDEKTQWINLVDDDTFFPSMPALLSMLGKYDPREQHYVGGISEDWWSVTKYGMMGFGGAGVFLSVTLAEVLASNYQLCKKTSSANAGDIRIMECIHQLTDTKLTTESNLHQVDLDGDLSGIYESGRLSLSLHHWKTKGNSGKGYNLPTMHLVSDVCGQCFLQRWQFGTDMILTNGYSIATYPDKILEKLRLLDMEATWGQPTVVDGSDNRGIDHSLAPIRPAMSLDQDKIQYTLIDSAVVQGGVRQSYLHKGRAGDIDTLLELFWMEKTEN